jgi:hypothetical protein
MKSKPIIVSVFVTICLVTLFIWYYYRYRQVELFETRKFVVFNEMELKILNEELENPYLLWDTNGKRSLEYQPFSEWKLTIHNQVPRQLDIGVLVYFPVSFNSYFPMFYKNLELQKQYFPTKNSMIITTETLEWEGNNNQIVIVGEKINLHSLSNGNAD